MQGLIFLITLLALRKNFWTMKTCRKKYLNKWRTEWKIVIHAHDHCVLSNGTSACGVVSGAPSGFMLLLTSSSEFTALALKSKWVHTGRSACDFWELWPSLLKTQSSRVPSIAMLKCFKSQFCLWSLKEFPGLV